MPKDPLENLKFRAKLSELALQGHGDAIWQLCKEDILFFINSACMVFEPREKKVAPFITWESFQDEAVLDLVRCSGDRDILIEKSRDMGASWMVLTVFFWQWLFHGYSALGLVSRTEDAVDKSDDPDTLMWKLDFHLKHLPWYLKPRMGRTDRGNLKLKNPTNESSIIGYSATGDVARGGRKLSFMMDELAAFRSDDGYAAYASTQHVTDCRIMLSTPQGAGGIFYEVANSDSPDIEVLTLPWFLHPTKSLGLYTTEREANNSYSVRILDEDYDFGDYPFIRDGKVRSPWYDRECRRSPVKRLIAQELDIDYSAAGSQFYEEEALRRADSGVMPPFYRGEIDFVAEQMEPTWVPRATGRLKIWTHLFDDFNPRTREQEQVPPRDRRYVIGCDIATGKGGPQSSNSVAAVIDITTGHKVAEFVSNEISPTDFARYVMALGRWFKGVEEQAYLIWEDNGPGGAFGAAVVEIGYKSFFFRVNESSVAKKRSLTPGWWSSQSTKTKLLAALGSSLITGQYVERSEVCAGEYRDYVYHGSNVVHQKSQHSVDPAHGGENHGDRVIATALAWRAVIDRPTVKFNKPKQSDLNPPRGTLAYRRNQSKKEVQAW